MPVRIPVEEPDDEKRIPLYEWLGFGLGSLILLSLVYIALSEQSITLGAPRGGRATWHSGANAVSTGFFLLALAMACWGVLLRRRHRWVRWTLLALVWAGTLTWYLKEKT